jgi:hypothetical protein
MHVALIMSIQRYTFTYLAQLVGSLECRDHNVFLLCWSTYLVYLTVLEKKQ